MPSDDDIPFINRLHLKWDNEDLLGEGSFGRVFRGRLHGMPVAIKVVKRANNTADDNVTPEQRHQELAALKQHRREIHRFKEFVNPHIIQYLGVFRDDDPRDLYIVTEYLEGGSLFDSLEQMRARRAILDDFSFVQIARHIAYGLNHVHAEKYTHGDIKPQNILLTAKFTYTEAGPNQFIAYLPPSAKVKIADFGLSKRLKGARDTAAQHNNNGTVGAVTTEFGPGPCGTLLYMSPEGYRGVRNLEDSQAMASDIYAYGLVLFELLSGLQSWQLERVTHPLQIASLVNSGSRPSWGNIKEAINPRFVKLVEDCWSQEYEDRPIASEILDLLNELHNEFNQNPPTIPTTSSGPSPDSPGEEDEPITSIDEPNNPDMQKLQNQQQHNQAQKAQPQPQPQPQPLPQPEIRKPDTPMLEIPSLKKPETPQLLIPPFQSKQPDTRPIPQNSPDHTAQQAHLQNEHQSPQALHQNLPEDKSDDAQFAQFFPAQAPVAGAEQSSLKPDPPELQIGALNEFVEGLPDATSVPGYQGRDYSVEYDSTFDQGNFETYHAQNPESQPNALPGANAAQNQHPANQPYAEQGPNKIPSGRNGQYVTSDDGGVLAVLVESISLNQGIQQDGIEQKQRAQPEGMEEPDENDTVEKVIMNCSNSDFPPPTIRKVDSRPFVRPINANAAAHNMYGGLVDNREERSNTAKLNSFIKAADPMKPIVPRGANVVPYMNPQLQLAQHQQVPQPIKPETPMLSLTALKPGGNGGGNGGNAGPMQGFAQRPQPNQNAGVGQLIGLPIMDQQSQQPYQQQQIQRAQQHHPMNNVPGDMNQRLQNPEAGHMVDGGNVVNKPLMSLTQFMDPAHVAPPKHMDQQQQQILPGQLSMPQQTQPPQPSQSHPQQQHLPQHPSHPQQPHTHQPQQQQQQPHTHQPQQPQPHTHQPQQPQPHTHHPQQQQPHTHQPHQQQPHTHQPHQQQPHTHQPHQQQPHRQQSPQQSPQQPLRDPSVDEPNQIELTLKSPNGWNSVMQIWHSGQYQTVARGLSLYKVLHGKDALYRVSELLRTSVTDAECRRDKELAKDLCTTIGNIGRASIESARYEYNTNDNNSHDRKGNELTGIDNATLRHALTVTLSCMYTFIHCVDVYAECNYAICSLLQVDNVVTDQSLRQHLATWVMHCIIWNVSDLSQGANANQQPDRDVLAYTSISAVRNFMWMNELNVQTVLQTRNHNMLSPLAHIINTAFLFDNNGRMAIVETCMATLLVAIQYPISRLAFAQHQGLQLATHIINRHVETQSSLHLIKVSLSTLAVMLTPIRAKSSNDQLTVDTISKSIIESDCAKVVVRAVDIARTRQHKLGNSNSYGQNPSEAPNDALTEDRNLSELMCRGLQALVAGLRYNSNVAHNFAESGIATLTVTMLNELIQFTRLNGRTEVRQRIGVALCDIVACLCRDGTLLRQMRQARVDQLVIELHDGSPVTESAIQACQAALQVNMIPAYG